MRRKHHFGLAAALGFSLTYIFAKALRREIRLSEEYWRDLQENTGKEATPKERNSHRKELH